MSLKIQTDYNRFKTIIRGKIKQDLKKFMSNGEMIGKKGKEFISIPLPRVTLPRFEHDYEKKGGVGQGDGDKGQPISGQAGQGQSGQGVAGEQPGEHILEVDISLEELASILGEELELPRIQPKGQKRKYQNQT